MTVARLVLSEAAQFFRELPDIAERAAAMAINQVVERKSIPDLRSDIESQVAFPSGYLDQESRFGMTKKASSNSLEAVITARDRPTSLARFAPGQTPASTKGKALTVQVKKGRAVTLKKAFLVTLSNGNIGLAVRLKQGESLRNKRDTKAVMLGKNLYLLYGPSVDQVFAAVADSSLPEIATQIETEFYRQVTRMSRGK